MLLLPNANFAYLLIKLVLRRGSERIYGTFAIFIIGYLLEIILLQGYEFSRLYHLTFLGLFFLFVTAIKYGDLVRRVGNDNCVGMVSDYGDVRDDPLYLGGTGRLEELLCEHHIDEILVAAARLSNEEVERIVKTAQKYHATASVVPPYFQFLAEHNYRVENWLGVPIVSIHHSLLAVRSHQVAKRAVDTVVSLFILVDVFPIVFLVITPAIWITSRGPIFFKQLRKGYKQKPFNCYKFRTMDPAAVVDETVQAKPNDGRVTRIGQSLRQLSLDEIPQFLNVLYGQMSVVGPRPHMVEHDKLYEKYISRYNVRFVTKPGITGWAQVNGLRGSVEGDPELLEKRVEHDLWYIKNWSIWLDVKIMYLTAVKLLFKGDQNAY